MENNQAAVDNTDQVDGAEVESQDTMEQNPQELMAELERARAEAAKERNIRKKLQLERDSWKKAKPETENSENYKELFQKQAEELTALREGIKTGKIENALRSQLTKSGVLPEAVEAAVKLIDHKFITYDDEAGVDTFGIETAVKKLKSDAKFMFETTVQSTKTRQANGGTVDSNTMTRAEFNKLPLMEQRTAALKFKITD